MDGLGEREPSTARDVRVELLRIVDRLAAAEGVSISAAERSTICNEVMRVGIQLLREPERLSAVGQLLFELSEVSTELSS